jgi:hypothetical protein
MKSKFVKFFVVLAIVTASVASANIPDRPIWHNEWFFDGTCGAPVGGCE